MAKRKAAEAKKPDEQFVQPHELATMASVMGAAAMEKWLIPMFGATDMTQLTKGMQDANRNLRDHGDMTRAESMLQSQAMALQVIFTHLSRQAAANMQTAPSAVEPFLRMALRAQAQCCKTLETLHEMKNPRPVAFVRQANIAHGPQQVNVHPPAPAHGNSSLERTELLEEAAGYGIGMDGGAQTAAGRDDSHLAPVGGLDRPPHP